jgi:hypothetical protein
MMLHSPHGIDFTKGLYTAADLDTYYTKFMRWRGANLITAGSYEDVLPGCFILVKMKGYCFFWDVLKNDYATLADNDGNEIDTGIRAYDDEVTAWMFSYTEPYVDSEYVLWSQFGMYEYLMSAGIPSAPAWPSTPLSFRGASNDRWFTEDPQDFNVTNTDSEDYGNNCESGGVYNRWHYANPGDVHFSSNNGWGIGDENYNGTWHPAWGDEEWLQPYINTGWKYTGYSGWYSGVGGPIWFRERYFIGFQGIDGSDKYTYFQQWLPYEELFYYPWFYASRRAVVNNSTGSYLSYLPVVKEVHVKSNSVDLYNSRRTGLQIAYLLGAIQLHDWDETNYDFTDDEYSNETKFIIKTPLGDIDNITDSVLVNSKRSGSDDSSPYDNMSHIDGLNEKWLYFDETEDVGTSYTRTTVTLGNAYMDTAAVYSRYFTSHIFLSQLLTRERVEVKAPGESSYTEVSDEYERKIDILACCKLNDDPYGDELNPLNVTESDRNGAFESAIQDLIDKIYDEYPVDEDAINTWDTHMSCHMYMPDRNKSGIRNDVGMAMTDPYTGMPIIPGREVEKEEGEPIMPTHEMEIE